MNKNYVDQKVYDYVPTSELDNETIVRTNKNNNFSGNTITGIETVYVHRNPIYDSELASKKYVDQEIDQSTILRLDPNEKFDNELLHQQARIQPLLQITHLQIQFQQITQLQIQ